MTVCFDLDGTICTEAGGQYHEAKPIPEAVREVQRLHDEGYTIVIDTARGSSTGRNWHALTEAQLRDWGVPYDQLYVGRKPPADIYVDDRGTSARDFFHGAA